MRAVKEDASSPRTFALRGHGGYCPIEPTRRIQCSAFGDEPCVATFLRMVAPLFRQEQAFVIKMLQHFCGAIEGIARTLFDMALLRQSLEELACPQSA